MLVSLRKSIFGRATTIRLTFFFIMVAILGHSFERVSAAPIGKLSSLITFEKPTSAKNIVADSARDCSTMPDQHCHQHQCQSIPTFVSMDVPVMDEFPLRLENLSAPVKPLLDRVPRPPSFVV